jgi:hypothetical protein
MMYVLVMADRIPCLSTTAELDNKAKEECGACSCWGWDQEAVLSTVKN